MSNATLARRNAKPIVTRKSDIARIAATNIALPEDEQISAGNFSVRIKNDNLHSEIYVMQMLGNIFKARPARAHEIAMRLHNEKQATIFTGSRDNCRMLMRQVAMHGGDIAANLQLGIDNDKGLETEMIRNSDNEIVQRSANPNNELEVVE